MMLRSILTIAVLLVFSIPALGQRKFSAEELEKLAAVFQKKLAEVDSQEDFPGATAAIVLSDGQVITAVAGFADVEAKSKMKPADRLMSASIGKTYFAALALQMIADGKFALEDKVSEYLGKESWYSRIPNSGELKIAHLMRHQSGIPRYILNRQVWKDIMDDPDLSWKPGDQLKYIYDRKPLHEAGKGWAYSDTNYILLGLILEKINGESVYATVRKKFLKPNKLLDTLPNDRRKLKGLVQGYSSTFAVFGIPDRVLKDGQMVFNPQMEWCGGGYCCTASDLARWASIYFSGQAFDGDYLDTMCQDAADSGRMLGRGSKYGLGVIIRDTKLGKVLGHDGGFPGYSSTMGYFSKHKIAASFMYNSDARGAISKRSDAIMIDLVQAVVDEIEDRK